jgi:uncharacterized protein DUF2510
MGLFRKVTSISTLGAVDFRSAKDRSAAYAKRSKKEAKRQTELQRQMLEQLLQRQPAQQLIPPGWYVDPGSPGYVRFWDGRVWTGEVRPR